MTLTELYKNDGTWTYFANDLAYYNKARNYDKLINILELIILDTKRIEGVVKLYLMIK